MPAVKFDPGFLTHPKVARLSDRGLRFWIGLVCHSVSRLTDGHISDAEAMIVARSLGYRAVDRLLEEVHAAGLLEHHDTGWVLHDFRDWQMSRAQIEAVRNATRQRVQKHRGVVETKPRRARHGFDLFWSIYPRKVGKIAAEAKWRTATDRATPEEIIDGLRRALPGWAGKEKRYIPHPATWLSQGRWMDEPEDTVELPASQRAVKAVLTARIRKDGG